MKTMKNWNCVWKCPSPHSPPLLPKVVGIIFIERCLVHFIAHPYKAGFPVSLYIEKANMQICKKPPKKTRMYHPQCHPHSTVTVILSLRHLRNSKDRKNTLPPLFPSVQKTRHKFPFVALPTFLDQNSPWDTIEGLYNKVLFHQLPLPQFTIPRSPTPFPLFKKRKKRNNS